MSDTDPNNKSVAISRFKMIALISIYAAPLLAAWLWLGYVRSNEGAGVSVNGELIKPAVPVTDFELQNAEGDAWGLDNLKEKWSMVYFSEDQCDANCEQSLYNMRQVRLSTGRRMERVQRVLVTTDLANMADKLKQAGEGLAVVGGSDEQLALLDSQFRAAQEGMAPCSGCIYLVDPFGNLMMRFAPELDPKKMYKDLLHLLKVSRIG
jgi:cytochrome oxidase Cu insertion factor (SCO1/SenC/PrrC family)